MAAIQSIDSGYDTYAIIERGKTYSGIADLEKFHNVGFDTDVDILSIICASDQDIVGTGAEAADSQVKERHEAGTLVYTDKDSNTQKTQFLNTGNVYKAVAEICRQAGNTALADTFEGHLRHGSQAFISVLRT